MTSFGELDLHLIGEGRHGRLYEHLGAHPAEAGVAFAVWAPNARAVSVVGDFNEWEEGASPLEPQGSSGVWAGVVATDFGKNALFGGPDSRTLPGAQPVEEVARIVADGMKSGPADVYTRPDGLERALGHLKGLAGAR